MKTKHLVTVAIAIVLTGIGCISMQAQTITSLSQSQFNAALPSSLWSFAYGIDSSIVFTENGASTVAASSANTFGFTSTTWNITLSIGNNNILTTATTSFHSPGNDWNLNSPIGVPSVTTIALAANYQAAVNEGMTISGITYNGGIPVAGTLTADQSNPFSGLTIKNTTPITSLGYLLTINTPNPSVVAPTLFQTVMVPSSVAEPSTLALAGLGAVTLGVVRKFKKKAA